MFDTEKSDLCHLLSHEKLCPTLSDVVSFSCNSTTTQKDVEKLVKRITFRLTKEQQEELLKVMESLNEIGLDLDESKLVRYVLNKGLEKLRLEGLIK